jgi:hypothetical protein
MARTNGPDSLSPVGEAAEKAAVITGFHNQGTFQGISYSLAYTGTLTGEMICRNTAEENGVRAML